jgi:hypothetical protein
MELLKKVSNLPIDLRRYIHSFVLIPYLLEEIRNYQQQKYKLYLCPCGYHNGYILQHILHGLIVSCYEENYLLNLRYHTLPYLKLLCIENGIVLPKYSRRKNYVRAILKLD